VHPEDASRVMLEVTSVASAGNQSMEYRFLHADGRYRWIHDEYKLVPLNASAELIGCWVDISELKETEFMLARQTRRLAKSNRELEQFAYVASHDLRAPLRALDTLSEWLEQDLDPVLTPGVASANVALAGSRSPHGSPARRFARVLTRRTHQRQRRRSGHLRAHPRNRRPLAARSHSRRAPGRPRCRNSQRRACRSNASS